MFIVWLNGAGLGRYPLIGALLFPFGLTYMIAALAVSWLIGFISAGL